ncbi:unnamed protein product, partial [Choristocarpus tenellus]
RHSTEPWRLYSKPVYVKMIHNITAVWGNTTAAVVEQPKQWQFAGHGLGADGATDLIKFVINTTSCNTDTAGSSGFDAELSSADSDGVAMYLGQGPNATFIFEDSVAGANASLCFKFGNEPYQWYNIVVYVHMVQSVGTLTGGEVFLINANGTSTLDYIRWIKSATSDSACLENDNFIPITNHPNAQGANFTNEAPVYLQSNRAYQTNFTFNS